MSTPANAVTHQVSNRRKLVTPTIIENLQVYLPLIVILVSLSLLAFSQNSAFLKSGNITQILVASSAVGILAVGQTVLLVGGMLDLSVGSLVSLGSVLAAKMVLHNVSDLLIVVICILVGSVVGLLWGAIVSFLKVPPFILTLGGLAVLASIALTIAKSTPIPLPDGLNWLQIGKILGVRTPILVWLLAVVAGAVLLHFTRFGRNAYAVGANEEAAYLSGISVKRTKILLFVFNGALGGLAGVIIAGRVGAGDPRGGVGLELITIAAIVLGGASLSGGRGTILGSILGVLVLGVVTSSLTFLDVPDTYDQFVFGAILIAAVTVTAVAELRRRGRVRRRD